MSCLTTGDGHSCRNSDGKSWYLSVLFVYYLRLTSTVIAHLDSETCAAAMLATVHRT